MIKAFAIACVGTLLGMGSALASDFEPDAKTFMTELISAAGEKGSPKALHDVSGHVDFENLAQNSLGRRWKKFPPVQRKDFLDTLESLIELVVYPKVKKITLRPEDIQYSPVPSNPNQVRAAGQLEHEEKGEVVKEKGDIVFVFSPKSHKIVDALIEGELLSANLKRQFDEALKKESFQAIIDRMKKRRDEAKNPEQS